MRLFLHKLTHWEYWPNKIVYIPVYFQWLVYGLRSGSFFFFNACNPTIRNGGFFNESKKEIYDLIPSGLYPKTAFVPAFSDAASVENIRLENALAFPLIAKPDIGLRGSAVKKVHNPDELAAYARKAEFDFLLQDCIGYENEIGIFYVRFPDEEKGRITGIVAKEFLIVTGDGKSTLLELLKKDPRFEMQVPALEKEHDLSEILPIGQTRNLVPYGNHARGAKFLDWSDRISEKLTDVIDSVCRQIDGFYFGRIDLMYKDWDSLEKGRDFQIVEVNGAGSEPTHIYDPKHSIWFAWKELSRHIGYMYRISRANHQKGAAYLTFAQGRAEWRGDNANKAKIYHF